MMMDRCRSMHCDCSGRHCMDKSSVLFSQVYRRTQRAYESAQRESNALLRRYCVCLYRKVSSLDASHTDEGGIDDDRFSLDQHNHHQQRDKSQQGTPVIPIVSAPEA